MKGENIIGRNIFHIIERDVSRQYLEMNDNLKTKLRFTNGFTSYILHELTAINVYTLLASYDHFKAVVFLRASFSLKSLSVNKFKYEHRLCCFTLEIGRFIIS